MQIFFNLGKLQKLERTSPKICKPIVTQFPKKNCEICKKSTRTITPSKKSTIVTAKNIKLIKVIETKFLQQLAQRLTH